MADALTDLERHVSYFDTDGDRAITMKETFGGLRRLGINPFIAGILTLIINTFLGFLTQKKRSSRVSVAHIDRGKHPYDTGTFDALGNLDERAFAALFTAPSTNAPFDRLTRKEVRAVIVKRGDQKKPFGELG
jgi:hypothetical protein